MRGESRAPREGEEVEKAFKALEEVAVLGGAQRMLDPFHYDQGMVERTILGLFPQVGMVKDLLGAMLKYGRYGQASFPRRTSEALVKHTPLVKAFRAQVDALVFPERILHQEIARESRRFISEVVHPGQPFVGEPVLDMDYVRLHEAIVDGDASVAQGVMREVLKEKTKEFGNDPIKALQAIRSSLLGRAPIPLSDENLVRFLLSLPVEKRKRFLTAQARYVGAVNMVAPALGR
jgi:hypothetical protein